MPIPAGADPVGPHSGGSREGSGYYDWVELKNKVRKYFQTSELLSIPEFKELAQTSRKYAVPLLEYFDKQKITYRDGNGRKLVK